MQVTARQAKRGQENAEAAALPAPALVAREIPITLARDLFPLSDGKSPRDSPALPSLSRLLQGCMAALPSLLGRTSWSDRFPPVCVAAIHPLAACTRASRESSPRLLRASPAYSVQGTQYLHFSHSSHPHLPPRSLPPAPPTPTASPPPSPPPHPAPPSRPAPTHPAAARPPHARAAPARPRPPGSRPSVPRAAQRRAR